MEFFRQEYWSGLLFPSPGDLPNPGVEPWSFALLANFYRLSHQGSPFIWLVAAMWDLLPRPGMEPGSPASEEWNPNNWTTREVQGLVSWRSLLATDHWPQFKRNWKQPHPARRVLSLRENRKQDGWRHRRGRPRHHTRRKFSSDSTRKAGGPWTIRRLKQPI